MNKVKGFKIKLRRREILKILKYSSKTKNIDTEIENVIQEEIERAYSLIFPCVVFKTIWDETSDFSNIQKKISLGSKKIEKLIKDSSAYTLIGATIGRELEKKVDDLKQDNLTRAVVLDAAGSEAAEQAAEFVSKILSEQAKKEECHLGNRYSPGYGDWPFQASKKISEILNLSKINVQVTNSGILIPRKSITAIQGWVSE